MKPIYISAADAADATKVAAAQAEAVRLNTTVVLGEAPADDEPPVDRFDFANRPIRLTETEFKDPQIYRRAKAEADRRGQTVEMVRAKAPAPFTPGPKDHVISAEDAKDVKRYRAARAEAERLGKQIKVAPEGFEVPAA